MKYILSLILLLLANATNANGNAKNMVQIVQGKQAQAWLLEDNSLPIMLINIEFLQAGSAYEGKAGVAQLIAAMLGEGAGDYSADAFNEELEQYAIEFGANASRDNFSIQLKTLRENLPKAMELLQAALEKPHFADADLARIKIEHLAGIKAMQESPAFHLQQLFYEQAFVNHPYANAPQGDEASIARIKAQDLREFMQAHFGQGNVKISIAGDVDAEAVKRDILPYFAKLPQISPPKALPFAVIPRLSEAKNHAMKVPQTSINLVYTGIKRDDAQFYAAYVLGHIIGGSSLSSKLGVRLREENGLVYGANAGFSQMEYANWFSASFATKSSQAALAIKLATQVIADAASDVAEGSITHAELRDAKDYLIGSFALETDSNAEKLQYLSMMQRLNLGEKYLQQRNSLIESVDLPQLKQVAKRLQGAPLMILSVGE